LPRDGRALSLAENCPPAHRSCWHFSDLANASSNFGFNLPWWDRVLGTYRDQPEAGHEGMTIGIEQFREPDEQRLDRMLTQPFRGDTRCYASAIHALPDASA
jgi:sterol desaturase/sphingolipid hydroxylase (fatty acid hydroxylase superfamily)